ncbi:hypothetical protein [Luteolibacter sp. Populi]|uniref:hypothetical protein n=1 Tax=Luteolibacter sp. Populi TaxID=3230487 RepID=UPI003466F331
MKKSQSTGRCAALAFAMLSLSAPALLAQAEGTRLVFVNGRSLPIANVTADGGKFTVKTAAEGFQAGNSFTLAQVSHVSGEKPAEISKGIGLMLMDESAQALSLLEPVVKEQRASATVPGNYWLEAARATVLAYSLSNEPAKAETLGKEISEITPESGVDPTLRLGQALMTPLTVKFDDRVAKLTEQINDSNPVEVSAYAAYFRGKLLKKINEPERQEAALISFLSIGCLYPASGLILTSAAEMNAAELVKVKPGDSEKRRGEALALLTSAARGSKGTVVGVAAGKALEGLK